MCQLCYGRELLEKLQTREETLVNLFLSYDAWGDGRVLLIMRCFLLGRVGVVGGGEEMI